MGTYRQPSQVLDTSHSIINKGIEGIYSNVSEQLRANKKALLAQEKENQKLLKQKKLNEIKRVEDRSKIDQKIRGANLTVEHSIGPEEEGYVNIRDKDNNIIRVKSEDLTKKQQQAQADNLGPSPFITTTDPATGEATEIYDPALNLNILDIDDDDVGGIQFSIEADVIFLYNKLGELDVNSIEYAETKARLNQVLDEAPVLVGLVNETTNNIASAFNKDGTLKPNAANIEGLILDDGKPNFELRKEAAQHIIFGTKQGRFSYESVGNDDGEFKQGGSYILYKSPTYGNLRISYNDYKKLVEEGGGLVGVTNRAPYDEIKKSIWELSKNRYDNVVVTKSIKDSQAAGEDRKKTITQTIKSYDDANALLLQDITEFVKQGGIGGHQYNQKNAIPGYNYLQNVWQMSGGDGFYDGSAEQEQQLIDNLYEAVKREYGSETVVTKFGITNSEYKRGKLKDNEKRALQVALKDGIQFAGYGKGAEAQMNTIRDILELEDDATSFDLEDVKTHYTKLMSDQSKLVAFLNSLALVDKGTPQFYDGVEIADQDDIVDPSRIYTKSGGSYEPIKDNLNSYAALEALILKEIARGGQTTGSKDKIKQALKDVDVVRVEEINDDIISDFA